jgi:hypothetical protein
MFVNHDEIGNFPWNCNLAKLTIAEIKILSRPISKEKLVVSW